MRAAGAGCVGTSDGATMDCKGLVSIGLDAPPQISLLSKLKLERCAPIPSRDGSAFFMGSVVGELLADQAL
jgi:hypothetical protein